MVAATFALRQCGLPAMLLWDSIRRPSPAQIAANDHNGSQKWHLHAPLYVHEDNQAMLACVRSGRSPTMRYLERTHQICVRWLHETCANPRIRLFYEESLRMAADIYTKSFTDLARWTHACALIQVGPPADLTKLASTFTPSLEEGGTSLPPPPRGGPKASNSHKQAGGPQGGTERLGKILPNRVQRNLPIVLLARMSSQKHKNRVGHGPRGKLVMHGSRAMTKAMLIV